MIEDPVPLAAEAQIVVFRLGADSFALPITHVNRISERQKITPVPKSPSFVEGVMDLPEAGRVIPVIDLRKRFGIEPLEDDRARIIVAEQGEKLIGLLVDAVDEVLQIPAGSIRPADEMVASVDAEFIAGIVRLENRLIILIDQQRVLNPTEARLLESVKLDGRLLPQTTSTSAEDPDQ